MKRSDFLNIGTETNFNWQTHVKTTPDKWY